MLVGATTSDATTFSGNTTGFNIASYGANGVTALTSYTTLPSSGASGSLNYIVTGSTPISIAESVNALLVIGDNILLSGAALTIGTGMLATSGSTTSGDTISAPVSFGPSEGVVVVNNGAVTDTGSFSGVSGLTFSGGGTLALNSVNNLPSTNAVQTLTFGAGNTGGTFALTSNGQTISVVYSNTLSVLQQNVQAALGALSAIGSPSNVLVGGTITALTVTFIGALAGAPQLLLLASAVALTGGANTLTIATTTPGVTSATTLAGGGTLVLGRQQRGRRRQPESHQRHPPGEHRGQPSMSPSISTTAPSRSAAPVRSSSAAP